MRNDGFLALGSEKREMEPGFQVEMEPTSSRLVERDGCQDDGEYEERLEAAPHI
jgi:hypothetical protein